jgi:DnaJ-class molecular chaperone
MLSRRDIIFCANRSSSKSSSGSIILRRKVLRASGESNEDNTNHKRRRQRRRPIEEMYNYFTKPVKCNECFGYNRRVCARCQGRGKTTTTFTDGDDDDNCCGGCVGRGYVRCDACNGTGLKNGWLFTVKGGWGPRGE